MKSYTDLSQSKKLAEILPLESADMEYLLEQWIDEKTYHHKEGYCEIPVVKVDDDCPLQPITHPCWSLAALLNILDFPALTQEDENEWKVCVQDYNNDEYIEITADSPVVACYEIIVKLHEQKLL